MKVIRFYLVAFVAVCATFVAKGEFTADFSHGEVTIRYAATPDRIDPAVDTMLTITVESPADLVVRLPDLCGESRTPRPASAGWKSPCFCR